MRRLIVLVVLMLLILINMPTIVQAGKIGKVINLLESIVTWPERTLVTKIEQEGSSVFRLTGNIDDFRPRKGGIKVCKAENKLFIGFYLSQRNINFYKGQVYEDGERKPVGLEVDVTDDNKVFDFADLQSITIVSAKGNSFDAGFYLDNPISDLKTVHTIGIANPGNLTPNINGITPNFSFPSIMKFHRRNFSCKCNWLEMFEIYGVIIMMIFRQVSERDCMLGLILLVMKAFQPITFLILYRQD